jgi:hypothetical protein
MQTSTNNVRQTSALLQTTGGKDVPNMPLFFYSSYNKKMKIRAGTVILYLQHPCITPFKNNKKWSKRENL